VPFGVLSNEPIPGIQLRPLDEPLVFENERIRASEHVVLVLQCMSFLLSLSIKLLLLAHSFVLPNNPLRFVLDDRIPYFLETLLNFAAS